MENDTIMDVTLLWFSCKNKDCNFIPLKTKKEKVKRAWRYGKSIQDSARPRAFMRYVEGNYIRKDNGDVLIFECKYGSILMYDAHDSRKETPNHYINPITDKEECDVCKKRMKNEGALFQ